ncbi:MAG: hypothetical protein KC996_03080 [Phycisphaerales bacterium]|nr:hypothetical protein [Phycisphaerales bacterium]
MLDPAPTTVIPADLARAKVLEFREAQGSKPAYAVLGFSNTDYKIFLEPADDCDAEEARARVGKKLFCVIHLNARKVTVSGAGGRFVDPISGTPNRVQGTVLAVDAESNTLAVNAGVPVHLVLTAPGQQASDFAVGDFIGCDVLSGSTFGVCTVEG